MKKNGKYCNKKSLNMKPLALLLALTLLVGCAVGGTIAWLTSETTDVQNTFTVGDINIELNESEIDNDRNRSYNFVPGDTLPKDPKVTVQPNSEGFITLTLTKTGSSKVDDFVKFTGEFTDGEQILTSSPAVVSVYSDTNSDFNIIRTFNSDIKFNTITNNSVLSDFKFMVSGSTDSLSDIVVMVDGEVFTNYTYNSFSKQISMDLSGLDEGIHYVSIGFKTDGGDLELIPRLKIRVGETQFVISNEW